MPLTPGERIRLGLRSGAGGSDGNLAGVTHVPGCTALGREMGLDERRDLVTLQFLGYHSTTYREYIHDV